MSRRLTRLPHGITIQQPVETIDQYKTPVTEWQDFASVLASVEPINGREFVLLKNTTSELTVRIRIYYYPGITTAMRVLYENRVFNIQSVIDYKELHQEMHLMCSEVFNSE
ncbi:MAG: phage head closure protein [Dehalobacter sp.]|nr:phage head closure protein [Dehalobacter sp.]